jgi:hypothetical protein
MRTLKAAFPDARLAGCDMDQSGVEFCARTFGAAPILSAADPAEIQIDDRFDLVWVGSMFTHLEQDRWAGFLRFLGSVLSPRGVLVFTTAGRFVVELMKGGQVSKGLHPEQAAQLIADYERAGFGYQEYRRRSGWGLARSSPAWVCATLDEVPELRLVSFVERGWLGLQDVVSCVWQDRFR